MPAKPVAFPFPIKGINQNWPYNAQPQLTTPDCQNVVSVDPTGGRARGGQRAGTSSMLDLGTARAVMRLNQVTRVVLEGGVTFADEFSYADGPLDGNGGWADESLDATWTIDGGELVSTAGTGLDAAARQTAGLAGFDQGDDFNVQVRFKFTTGTSDGGTNDGKKTLYLRLDDNGGAAVDWTWLLTETAAGTATLFLGTPDDGGGATLSGVSVSRDDYHTLELDHVASTGVTRLILDGTTHLTQTSGPNAAASLQLFMEGSVDAGVDTETNIGATRVTSVRVSNGTGSARSIKVAAVSAGSVYVGSIGSDGTLSMSMAADGNGVFVRSFVDAVDGADRVYYADGHSVPKYLDVSDDTVKSLVATAGTLPDTPGSVTLWRDRLIYYGVPGDEQNLFASRAGTHTDFDYNPTVPDELQAFALNSSTAGRVGQPIWAAAPFRDDVLVIFCDHSTYALVGDPAAQGSLVTLSDSVGALGPSAWCIVGGSIFFAGTDGLYRMDSAEAPPVLLSGDRVNRIFRAIDRNLHTVSLVYDDKEQGVYIFIERKDGHSHDHWYLDLRFDPSGAFFKLVYPQSHGPFCAMKYNGDGDDDRFLMLGGKDGKIRKLDEAATSDDGEAIVSYLFIGPVNPGGPFQKSRLVEIEAVSGNGTNRLDWEVRAGSDAYAALNAAAACSGSFTSGGRQAKVRSRARGNTFMLKLSNSTLDKRWSMERIAGRFEASGQQR